MNAAPEIPLLLNTLENGVLRLTLNRARARNALSSGLMTALAAALDRADASARVIVRTIEMPRLPRSTRWSRFPNPPSKACTNIWRSAARPERRAAAGENYF